MPKEIFADSPIFMLEGEELLLLSQKAIFWKAKEILLIADLHLGKALHFRNNGIFVPKKVAEKNWDLLHQLFQEIMPKKVYFLGDLFHSSYNSDWDTFKTLISAYADIEFVLVLGNHDILEKKKYEELGFTVVKKLIEPPFLFTHEPLDTVNKYYNIAGHVHPAVIMKGKGKQYHRAACFYFGEKQGLLPAFGAFTGMHTIKVDKLDQIFVVVNEQVHKV